ncbi:MAG: hypothetical protein ABSG43_12835 [Solirubrobacteraceae bacterium]
MLAIEELPRIEQQAAERIALVTIALAGLQARQLPRAHRRQLRDLARRDLIDVRRYERIAADWRAQQLRGRDERLLDQLEEGLAAWRQACETINDRAVGGAPAAVTQARSSRSR